MKGILYKTAGLGRGKGNKEGGEKRGRDDEKELEKGEVRRTIKNGKAVGGDGIPGKVWKYGGEEVEEWVWRFSNKVWKEEGWPEAGKKGEIVSIVREVRIK